MSGTRVTDAVEFFRQREEHRQAVRLVRARTPETRRWKHAVARMSATVGSLRGREKSFVDEPLREMVIDLDDRALRAEVVLDARRANVDWDRGEILAPKTMGDLRRASFLAGIELSMLRPHVAIPEDFFALIDVAGVIVAGRAFALAYHRRAQRLVLELPLVDDPSRLSIRQQGIAAQVARDDRDAKRWSALSKAMLDGTV